MEYTLLQLTICILNISRKACHWIEALGKLAEKVILNRHQGTVSFVRNTGKAFKRRKNFISNVIKSKLSTAERLLVVRGIS